MRRLPVNSFHGRAYYGKLAGEANPRVGFLSMSVELGAPETLVRLVGEAEKAGASDIHLQMGGAGAAISLRCDGVLSPTQTLPAELAEHVFGRIKFLARLKTYQDSLPQEGRIGRGELGTRHDVRVATYPTVTGEKIVLRLFNDASAKSLSELGFPEAARTALEKFLAGTSGMLLLTGPAGSGKTTTIYACLRQLVAAAGRHIITVEDPVEQIIPGVMQTEVCEARGLTFAKAARHLLRQDPQVLVLGEIRDDETANLAVRAALTGHMVISTLHAGSCKGVWDRFQIMCGDPYAVATTLELVLNQRLLRRLCVACQGHGCAVCTQTGYHGCVPVVEWVRANHTDNAAVVPAPLLAEAGRELVASGVTTPAEFRRVFGQ